MRPRLSLIAIAIGAAGLVAGLAVGCGSSSSSSTSTSAANSGPNYQGSPASTSTSGTPATISVANNSDLGPILVDGKGRTLYLFEKDESDESYCNGGCAKVWPPVTTSGAPKPGKGVTASKLATLKRDDGTTQVVYDGHPLYGYVDDRGAGDAKGNELDQFGAEWYALHPNGKNAESGSKS